MTLHSLADREGAPPRLERAAPSLRAFLELAFP